MSPVLVVSRNATNRSADLLEDMGVSSPPLRSSNWRFTRGVYQLLVCVGVIWTVGCATIRKFNPIESHTLEARQLTQQAETAIHREAWDEAETMLVDAIERCPEDHRARAVLSEVLWRRGQRRAAVEQLSKSIELSGRRDPFALTELGNMEFSMGRYEMALRRADEVLSQDNSLADAWTLRAAVMRAQHRHHESLNAYLRALSIRKDDPQTRLEIAKIFREIGQPQRALAMLGTAPKESEGGCPHFPEICYLRGLLMRDLDRPSDAAMALAVAQQSGCEIPDLLIHLADAQLAAGDLRAAQVTLEDASVSSRPEFQVALSELQDRITAELPNHGPILR